MERSFATEIALPRRSGGIQAMAGARPQSGVRRVTRHWTRHRRGRERSR